MDDLHNVRKRIKKRRFGIQDEEERQPFSLFKWIYRFVMLIMCICVLMLAVLLNQKLNFVKMPAVLQNFKIEDIQKWIPFETWFSLKDSPVSTNVSYTKIANDQYTNGTNRALTIFDAVVLHVQKSEAKKSTVTLRQDNGVIATYSNLDDVTIKQDERILKGSAIGTYQEYVSISFLKDNKKIDLHDAQAEKI